MSNEFDGMSEEEKRFAIRTTICVLMHTACRIYPEMSYFQILTTVVGRAFAGGATAASGATDSITDLAFLEALRVFLRESGKTAG